MSFYDTATHGWHPDEGPPAIERHPFAVYAVMASPFLAVLVYGVAST